MCRFFHGAVDIVEAGREIDQNKRKVVNALNENYTVQTLHERDVDTEPLIKQQIDAAITAK